MAKSRCAWRFFSFLMCMCVCIYIRIYLFIYVSIRYSMYLLYLYTGKICVRHNCVAFSHLGMFYSSRFARSRLRDDILRSVYLFGFTFCVLLIKHVNLLILWRKDILLLGWWWFMTFGVAICIGAGTALTRNILYIWYIRCESVTGRLHFNPWHRNNVTNRMLSVELHW